MSWRFVHISENSRFLKKHATCLEKKWCIIRQSMWHVWLKCYIFGWTCDILVKFAISLIFFVKNLTFFQKYVTYFVKKCFIFLQNMSHVFKIFVLFPTASARPSPTLLYSQICASWPEGSPNAHPHWQKLDWIRQFSSKKCCILA